MSTRKASCQCGQLRIEATGEPIRVSVCHCLACQRRSGSAFSFQARFPRANVHIAGNSKEHIRTADSGRQGMMRFCPDCGSTVYYFLADNPDVIAIPVGGFADPSFPPPKFSVYEERQHSWVHVPGDVEHMN